MATASVGDVIGGKYKLVREIARGGMGWVFEAVHVHTERVVAIKCLPPNAGKGESELAARLTREAKALGRVRHPGVVDVVDGGICPKIGPFIAMEMLEGRPLDGILATRRRLSVADSIGVVSALASALGAAHRAGIIHRDVKPSNVFVARTNDGERIKLIDFGIARISMDEREARITRAGDLLGTLDYMAPEQLSSIERSDERSDQYSLAVLAYECITGELPHLAARLLPTTYAPEAIRKKLDAPPRVSAAIARAMHPDQSHRFESIEEFANELVSPSGERAPAPHLLAPLPHRSPHASATMPKIEMRRRHVRSAYVTPCRIVRDDGSYLDGRSEDISEGGMLVLVEHLGSQPIKTEGEDVVVKFALPTGGRVIQQRARIRWIKDARGRAAIGVEFQAPEPASVASIATYVKLIGSVAA
jgi:serine/threonine protein kinase